MYRIRYTKTFAKSFARLVRGGLKPQPQKEIAHVIRSLANGEKLHATYRDHALKGAFLGYRECHIQGDLLLLYSIHEDELVLVVINIGSHNQLFS